MTFFIYTTNLILSVSKRMETRSVKYIKHLVHVLRYIKLITIAEAKPILIINTVCAGTVVQLDMIY